MCTIPFEPKNTFCLFVFVNGIQKNYFKFFDRPPTQFTKKEIDLRNQEGKKNVHMSLENHIPENLLERYLSPEEIERITEVGFSQKTGLRMTLEGLVKKKMELLDIRTMTMEQIAKYVDAITYIKTENNEWTFFQTMLGPIQENHQGEVSLTGLGNVAYVALYIKEPNVKKHARMMYDHLLNSIVS